MPFGGSNRSREIGVEGLDKLEKLRWGMVVPERVEDKGVVNTTIRICQIKPAYGKGLVLLFGILEDLCQHVMVFNAAWGLWHECLLH